MGEVDDRGGIVDQWDSVMLTEPGRVEAQRLIADVPMKTPRPSRIRRLWQVLNENIVAQIVGGIIVAAVAGFAGWALARWATRSG
jgi:hypothetical protein